MAWSDLNIKQREKILRKAWYYAADHEQEVGRKFADSAFAASPLGEVIDEPSKWYGENWRWFNDKLSEHDLVLNKSPNYGLILVIISLSPVLVPICILMLPIILPVWYLYKRYPRD